MIDLYLFVSSSSKSHRSGDFFRPARQGAAHVEMLVSLVKRCKAMWFIGE